ncbi:MAG: hypothetical protein N2C14_20605 [Planctomycetales bacterium]
MALGTVFLKVFFMRRARRNALLVNTNQSQNWFYPLTMLCGVFFTITACAYGWMTFLATQVADPSAPRVADSSVMQFLDDHGLPLLGTELLLLALTTFGAVMLDHVRAKHSPSQPSTPPPATDTTKDRNDAA